MEHPKQWIDVENSYLDLYLNGNFPNNNPTAILSLMFLTLARLLPIIAFSPFFGSKILPHPVKVTFALSLFAIFLPLLLQITQTPLDFNVRLLGYMGKEVFVGICIGFTVGVPFMIAQNVGMIIDHQRGGASLMVNDPTIQNQSSPLGTLFNMVLIVLFFQINGPFYFIDAIVHSYEVIPPDRFLNPAFFSTQSSFWDLQIKLLNKMMVISMQLAAPALIAILMTDFFLGIANRLAPQVQITFLGMPLKSLLALLVICIGWKLFNQQLVKDTIDWLHIIDQVTSWFGIGMDESALPGVRKTMLAPLGTE